MFFPALSGSCLARFAYFFADLCIRNGRAQYQKKGLSNPRSTNIRIVSPRENRFHGTQLMFVASAYSRSAWISISSHSHLLTCRRVIIAVTNILIFPHFSEWRGSDTTRKYNNIQLPPVWARLQYGRYTRCIYGQRLRYLKLPT